MNAHQSDHNRWFSEQVQPHESSLKAHLRSFFGKAIDVDDLVQEAYVRMIRARSAGKIGYAKAFLYSTARNLAFDLFRRRQIVSIDTVADLNDLPVLDEKPDVGEALDRQQALERLAESVRTLPEKCRQVLTLRLLYGYSQKEIAARLGVSEHTVKAQLAKGMRRCAKILRREKISSL